MCISKTYNQKAILTQKRSRLYEKRSSILNFVKTGTDIVRYLKWSRERDRNQIWAEGVNTLR
jgi:hypothetical protein